MAYISNLAYKEEFPQHIFNGYTFQARGGHNNDVIIYRNAETKHTVFGIRGTASLTDALETWIPIISSYDSFKNSKHVQDDVKFIRSFERKHIEDKYTYTGHSKGGAESIVMILEQKYAGKRDAVIFNTGFGPGWMNIPDIHQYDITSYRVPFDIVSVSSEHVEGFFSGWDYLPGFKKRNLIEQNYNKSLMPFYNAHAMDNFLYMNRIHRKNNKL